MKENFNIQKNFGFGCMRLPMNEAQVDYQRCNRMFDTFMDAGFNYFDTAHGYMDGKSEGILQKCLTSRYPRESYVLTNKLSTPFFHKQEDIRPLFQSQLEACGVDYFDFYLMHAQDKELFEKYKKCKAYETALELQAEGKFKHFGISFHDKAEVLEQILTEYPQIEVVQIQLNYVDYEDVAVDSKRVYEVCRKYRKPVIVMEPVKGGCLVNLPEEAKAIFDCIGSDSYASYALRFAASFEGVIMVLSGMGTLEMVEENIACMGNFQPLNEHEQEAVRRVCRIFKAQDLIACTACRYCTDSCPQDIPIPDIFACLNSRKTFHSWNPAYYYSVNTHGRGKAGDCVACGNCEALCPQHLPIRALLQTAATEFEKKK